jgi:hypothetical protein
MSELERNILDYFLSDIFFKRVDSLIDTSPALEKFEAS